VPSSYRGRFAPSPTGPLHFGSLVAATASYLDARSVGGEWLVRIEDLDPPREVPGSADDIIATLEAFGFQWNESIVRQGSRAALYEPAVRRLEEESKAYRCSCSRREVALLLYGQTASADPEELHYPGLCRAGPLQPDRPCAVRFLVPEGNISFDDAIQGRIDASVAEEVGDFVIRRRDGLFSYQLAVVVDDAEQRITHVVRGSDLLNSTARQILLQRALGLPTPAYAHVPVATDRNGVKLSKSAGAAAIDSTRPGAELWRVLQFLQLDPPPGLRLGRVAALWNWAIGHWSLARLRGISSAPVDSST
jgi:glutamyl-Q tRNA(Asp) synthetase